MAAGATEEVRTHVLTAHARLRARSAELASEALRIAHGATDHDVLVRCLVVELWANVEATDQLEKRELFPLLAKADAWGSARVERLRERHARHERDVCTLAVQLGEELPAREAVVRIDGVLRTLLSDLDDEEATSLEPELLDPEDPVIGDQTTG
jgi:hypothetical protein